MKAIFIDSANQQIREIEVTDLADLQERVNGYIETATQIGDNVIYVDEEGLFKGYSTFFKYGNSQPFAGNGVIVGVNREEGEEIDTDLDIEEVKERVEFIPSFLIV